MVDRIAEVFGDSRDPWYAAAGIPVPGRLSRQMPTALATLGLAGPEPWEAMIELAERMPWPKSKRDLVIQGLRELQVEMGNRYRFELPPSTYDYEIESIKTSPWITPEEKERLVDHLRRMQALYGVPEPEAEEQPALAIAVGGTFIGTPARGRAQDRSASSTGDDGARRDHGEWEFMVERPGDDVDVEEDERKRGQRGHGRHDATAG